MNHELIERYIYAVTRRLPSKQREDVSRELGGLIDDLLTERCGGITPSEKDIRVVLTELGSPQELYEKYDENSKKCLIGQPYYSTYLFVLKIVLISAAVGLTIANLLLQLMDPQVWYAAVGSWLAMLWKSLMGTFGFVTLMFSFFYHFGVKIDKPFNFDDLPPVPKKKQQIPCWEPIVGIVISVVFLILFLTAPQAVCIIYKGGEFVPLFNSEIMRDSWYIIALFTLVGVTREVIKLLEKRYNRRVMVVTIVCNGLSMLLAVWWLTGKDLFNPEFKEKMVELFLNEEMFMARFFEGFQYFFLAVMLLALAMDTIETIVKSLRK